MMRPRARCKNSLRTLLTQAASATAIALATAMPFAALPAHADELSDASALLRQKQHAQALDKVNQFLASKPRDAQGRFLKGLILADQNKTAEAIDIFTKLTQDYPELPEPYNNLAVLYATQGQYEKARQSLEMSIRTHPSYATAYENLGDVYAKLASQAYNKALQLDSSNNAAKSKLSMVRELISGGTRGGAAVAAPSAPSRPTVVAAATPPQAAPAAAPAAPATPATAAAARAPDPKAAAKAAEPAPAAKAPATPSPATQEPAAKSGNDEIIKTVRAWASAWADKDVKTYLGHYAKDFKTPNGESRADWEKGRRQRIQAPKKIEVSVDSPKVTVNGDTATVTFRQRYRSDSLKVSSTKTLVLAQSGGKWMIKQERTRN
jgi:tetratricopeptide (TPR) repeat protein